MSFIITLERGRAAELRSRWNMTLERAKDWKQP